MIPDRRVLKIEELNKRVRELEAQCGEQVQHKS
jgi:acetone carboxylase alpha subunit